MKDFDNFEGLGNLNTEDDSEDLDSDSGDLDLDSDEGSIDFFGEIENVNVDEDDEEVPEFDSYDDED